MKSERITLKRDQYKIDNAASDLRRNLQTAQEYLNWYRSIEFAQPLEGIEDIKKFLDSPHTVYEEQIKRHLKEVTGLKTLPERLEQLKEMYAVPDCQAWCVSDEFGFEFLQIDKDGQLFYSQEIYDQIEAGAVRYASPEEAAALAELNRVWADLERLAEILFPTPGMSRQMWFKEVTDPLSSTLRNQIPGRTPDPSLLTPWRLDALEKLAAVGFGQNKTK